MDSIIYYALVTQQFVNVSNTFKKEQTVTEIIHKCTKHTYTHIKGKLIKI